MILHLVEDHNGPSIYVDAHADYLSASQARRLAIKLIELAHRIAHPITASEWP
ncbi:hypothetical protein [Cryobacterium sp. Hh38]|uniref:hypothetical protein n=1 Tax=Cryobacterium sp. Hh38 TaxID=1259156 RepID=UPI00141B62BC|nr:hypothetical protein [Cryobacterium sp. Hh38]